MRAGKLLLLATFALSVLASSAQTSTSSSSSQTTAPAEPEQQAPPPIVIPPDALPKVPVTDEDRSSVTITNYDLDLHLTPAESREEVRATLTLRNTSAAALTRIPIQVSGTLRFERISAATPAGLRPVDFTQSPIATDSDHTGYAQEAILTPTEPLAPNATLTLSVLYGGEIKQSADRLTLIGAESARAALTDWDAIVPTTDTAATALRGFGNVLWYPVAQPAAALGDGNKLFALVEQQRAANPAVTMRLRLTVEYSGEPPDSAIFNGQLQPLTQSTDLDNETVAESHGVATASWPAAPIGFRIPSLFLAPQHAVATPDQMLNIITPDADAIPPYADAAKLVAPLLNSWMGVRPNQLLVLDHQGEPFADHNLLVAQLAADARPDDIAPTLVGPLTQAWLASSYPWISEGFAQFMRVLWTERLHGRDAALANLAATNSEIAFLVPDVSQSQGQPLISATSAVYFRLKAAFVWWQLREIAGEPALQQAVSAYRATIKASDADPRSFEKILEGITKTDLAWFFSDWVYRDRGLPDLTIVQAAPRPLPARPGKDGGYLVVVDVRNDGDAIADVPVILSAGTRKLSSRLRIPPHSTAATRILFEDYPETVQVNDGSVPELQNSTHVLKLPTP